MGKIAVIGGGPAGMFAALAASEKKSVVTIFEKSPCPGTKLSITGGGRANISNNCKRDSFIQAFYEKKNFVKKSFFNFDNKIFRSYLKTIGIMTFSDKQGRIFPKNCSAKQLRNRLVSILKSRGINIKTGCDVFGIDKLEDGFKLMAECGTFYLDSLIIASGGKSWPSTGSVGTGYQMARELGHTIVEPVPGLTNLKSEDIRSARLAGISLNRCQLKFLSGGKKRTVQGGLVFTHTGISGPAVLDISRFVSRELLLRGSAAVVIDFIPEKTKDALKLYFMKNRKKHLKKAVARFIPLRLANYILSRQNINGSRTISDIGEKKITALVDTLKSLLIDVMDTGGWEKAMVTCGGVETKEINSLTMESRVVSGLYFAGEVIDIDGPTGGYNVHIACATGFAAGRAAANISNRTRVDGLGSYEL